MTNEEKILQLEKGLKDLKDFIKKDTYTDLKVFPMKVLFKSGVGFNRTNPIVQPGAYTQTYTSSGKTNAAATASTISTTSATQTTPWGFASQAQAEDIATQFNKLRTDHINLQKLVNAIIDDLQSYGLLQ